MPRKAAAPPPPPDDGGPTTEQLIDDDYGDETLEAPGDAELVSVAELARKQVALEATVADLTDALKEATDSLNMVAMVELPAALANVGMAMFKLEDGTFIEVEEKVVASITKANAPAAFKWLRDNKHGDLIKKEAKFAFARDQDKLVAKLIKWAEKNLAAVKRTDSEAVHPQTLGAFVREQLTADVDIPEDIFGVHRIKRATVTPAGATPASPKKKEADL